MAAGDGEYGWAKRRETNEHPPCADRVESVNAAGRPAAA